MNKWIRNFAYRINIAWWIFAVAGIIAVSIALITACKKTPNNNIQITNKFQ